MFGWSESPILPAAHVAVRQKGGQLTFVWPYRMDLQVFFVHITDLPIHIHGQREPGGRFGESLIQSGGLGMLDSLA